MTKTLFSRSALLALFLLSLCMTLPVAGANAAPKFGLEKLAVAKEPTSLASPPGYPSLIFVTGREGQLQVIRRGKLVPKPLLNLRRQLSLLRVERGLLGLAFAPDFRKTGRFYLNFTNRKGNSIVAEYRTKVGRPLQLASPKGRIVIAIPRVNNNGNHNGGHMDFHDGLLYISVGDGFDPGDPPDNAQNIESLRGKILRIDPRPDSSTGLGYRIPPDNPYVGLPGRDEIFAFGFRNPHSFDFFRQGDREMIVISDVGQGRFEELNVLPLARARGANFGWNDYEGFEPYNCGDLFCPNGVDPTATTGLAWPQLVFSHDEGCAIIGGPRITDPELPALRGRLIYGDFCANRIRTAAPRYPTIRDDKWIGFYMPPGKDKHSALNGFGVDGFKRLYAFSHFGPIYRIVQR